MHRFKVLCRVILLSCGFLVNFQIISVRTTLKVNISQIMAFWVFTERREFVKCHQDTFSSFSFLGNIFSKYCSNLLASWTMWCVQEWVRGLVRTAEMYHQEPEACRRRKSTHALQTKQHLCTCVNVHICSQLREI